MYAHTNRTLMKTWYARLLPRSTLLRDRSVLRCCIFVLYSDIEVFRSCYFSKMKCVFLDLRVRALKNTNSEFRVFPKSDFENR